MSNISWKVVAWSYAFPQGVLKQEFGDSSEAEAKYSELLGKLANPNDRIILYRIKLAGWGRRYQDAYKSDVLGHDGKFIHVRNQVPTTIEDAEFYRNKARSNRRLLVTKHKFGFESSEYAKAYAEHQVNYSSPMRPSVRARYQED